MQPPRKKTRGSAKWHPPPGAKTASDRAAANAGSGGPLGRRKRRQPSSDDHDATPWGGSKWFEPSGVARSGPTPSRNRHKGDEGKTYSLVESTVTRTWRASQESRSRQTTSLRNSRQDNAVTAWRMLPYKTYLASPSGASFNLDVSNASKWRSVLSSKWTKILSSCRVWTHAATKLQYYSEYTSCQTELWALRNASARYDITTGVATHNPVRGSHAGIGGSQRDKSNVRGAQRNLAAHAVGINSRPRKKRVSAARQWSDGNIGNRKGFGNPVTRGLRSSSTLSFSSCFTSASCSRYGSRPQSCPNGTETSSARARLSKTAFGQLRNKRQNELAAASIVSEPFTGNRSALAYTKRWNGCKGTW